MIYDTAIALGKILGLRAFCNPTGTVMVWYRYDITTAILSCSILAISLMICEST